MSDEELLQQARCIDAGIGFGARRLLNEVRRLKVVNAALVEQEQHVTRYEYGRYSARSFEGHWAVLRQVVMGEHSEVVVRNLTRDEAVVVAKQCAAKDSR